MVLLAQALPVLQKRMDKGTLLPGKLRSVEEAYCVYKQQMIKRVKEKPVPSEAQLGPHLRMMGYDTALGAAVTALGYLPLPPWRADQRERAQAFVLVACASSRRPRACCTGCPSSSNWWTRSSAT